MTKGDGSAKDFVDELKHQLLMRTDEVVKYRDEIRELKQELADTNKVLSNIGAKLAAFAPCQGFCAHRPTCADILMLARNAGEIISDEVMVATKRFS